MQTRNRKFDNGLYIDGKRRIVTIIDANGNVIGSQNPYSKKQKNCKQFY